MQCWDDGDVDDIRMGDEARWQDLDAMIGRLSDDPATEWTDVRELFIK